MNTLIFMAKDNVCDMVLTDMVKQLCNDDTHITIFSESSNLTETIGQGRAHLNYSNTGIKNLSHCDFRNLPDDTNHLSFAVDTNMPQTIVWNLCIFEFLNSLTHKEITLFISQITTSNSHNVRHIFCHHTINDDNELLLTLFENANITCYMGPNLKNAITPDRLLEISQADTPLAHSFKRSIVPIAVSHELKRISNAPNTRTVDTWNVIYPSVICSLTHFNLTLDQHSEIPKLNRHLVHTPSKDDKKYRRDFFLDSLHTSN